MCRKIVLLIVISLFGFLGFAENAQNRYALVIGNQSYEDNPLKTPVADSDFLAQTLSKCGFEISLVQNADSNQLRNSVLSFVNKVNQDNSNSIVVIYYSGYAIQSDGKNYLVPVNNSNIISVAAIRQRSVCVDEILSPLKSKKQVLLLDASRINPVPGCKEYIQNGLAPVKAASGSTLSCFMSVAPNTIQEDFNTKYSAFASALGWDLQKVNCSLKESFEEVLVDVQEITEGRQSAFIVSDDTDFILLDEQIASESIVKLTKAREEAVNQAKTITDSELKRQNTEKQNQLNNQISLLKEKKEETVKDAALKKKNKRKNAEKERKIKLEIAEKTKNFSKVNTKLLKAKAQQKSSADFIIDLEKTKVKVQSLRKNAYDKIIEADTAIQKKADAVIEKSMLCDPKQGELKDNGTFTSQAKLKRCEEAMKTQEDADNQKKKNYKKYAEEIAREEQTLASKIDNANTTLNNAFYSASSLNGEVLYYVSDFDKNISGWKIRVWSNFLEFSNLYDEHLVIPYSLLKGSDQDVDIAVFNKLFKDKENSPLEVRVDYTIKPADGKDSTYYFNATRIVVSYLLGNGSVVELASSNIDVRKEMILHPNTHVASLEQMYDEYNKKNNQELKKIQNQRQKKLDSYQNGYMQTENADNPIASTVEDVTEKIGNWGGNQKSISGLYATLGIEDKKLNLMCGYAFDFLDHIYVAPVVTSALPSFDGSQNGYIGIGAAAGLTVTYDLKTGSYLEPIFQITCTFDTLNVFNFTMQGGCGYAFNKDIFIDSTLGLTASAKNGPGFTWEVGTVIKF